MEKNLIDLTNLNPEEILQTINYQDPYSNCSWFDSYKNRSGVGFSIHFVHCNPNRWYLERHSGKYVWFKQAVSWFEAKLTDNI